MDTSVRVSKERNAPFATSASDDHREDDDTLAPAARTFVMFELGGQWLAVDVEFVREILDRQSVTTVPAAPSGIQGVVDVRGSSVAVADLSGKLGIPACEDTEDNRLLVFEFTRPSGEPRAIAVRADKVLEVSQISDREIEKPPGDVSCGAQGRVLGVVRPQGRLAMIIDIRSIFETDLESSAPAFEGEAIFEFD